MKIVGRAFLPEAAKEAEKAEYGTRAGAERFRRKFHKKFVLLAGGGRSDRANSEGEQKRPQRASVFKADGIQQNKNFVELETGGEDFSVS